MREPMEDGVRRQQDSTENSYSALGDDLRRLREEAYAMHLCLEMLSGEGVTIAKEIRDFMARQTVAVEAMLQFVTVAGISVPSRKKKIRRTKEQVRDIVQSAINLVETTRMSDREIAKHLGVPREVFNRRDVFREARLEADRKAFSSKRP